MLTMLKNYRGSVEVNGARYSNIHDAIRAFSGDCDTVSIKLRSNHVKAVKSEVLRRITVKPYMTQPASPEFDFMTRWNNDVPMPLRTMVGTVEKETRGMVYMNLHADITEERTMYCLKCGRHITNPISQYFGMGPECGGHNYVNPFYSEEELMRAVKEYRKQLRNITWSGWIIKSAILSDEEVEITDG